MKNVADLTEKYYGRLLFGQRALTTAIRQVLSAGYTQALDAGCGSDASLTREFSCQAWVVGVDLSPQLPADLPVVRSDLAALPFCDRAFNLIYSRSVFEHLADPDRVLCEFHRVLQPGGRCIILTPNRWDYSSVVARWTPQGFHQWFITRAYGPHSYDTFPTHYRGNTPGYFRKFVESHRHWRIREISGLRHYPANLKFSRTLFRLGVLYDWIIWRLGLKALQPSVLVILEKVNGETA